MPPGHVTQVSQGYLATALPMVPPVPPSCDLDHMTHGHSFDGNVYIPGGLWWIPPSFSLLGSPLLPSLVTVQYTHYQSHSLFISLSVTLLSLSLSSSSTVTNTLCSSSSVTTTLCSLSSSVTTTLFHHQVWPCPLGFVLP